MIRENMNWESYKDNILVIDTGLYWLAFTTIFIVVAGFISYRLAKFCRIAHPIFLSLICIILPIMLSDKVVPIWFTALHSSLLLIGFSFGGWLSYKYEIRKIKNV